MTVTVHTRKFMTNRLLGRKQMIVDVIHPNRANVSKAELRSELAKKYKVSDEQTVCLFGFRTQFGGGKSTGFCLIYDSMDALLDSEPNFRLVRYGMKDKPVGSRKARKELKNRRKKARGKKKAQIGA